MTQSLILPIGNAAVGLPGIGMFTARKQRPIFRSKFNYCASGPCYSSFLHPKTTINLTNTGLIRHKRLRVTSSSVGQVVNRVNFLLDLLIVFFSILRQFHDEFGYFCQRCCPHLFCFSILSKLWRKLS